MSDSTSSGFLRSTGNPPLNDDQLQDLLQTWFVGLVGIDPSLVRPRWQANPPDRPPAEINWLAFGIADRPGDWDGHVSHVAATTTSPAGDLLYANEELVIECSAYGPGSDAIRSAIWTGTKISQNLDLLRANGMGFIEVGQPRSFGERIKQIIIRRVDFRVRLRRAVGLLYSVQDLDSASASLILSDPLLVENIEPTDALKP